MILVAKRQGVNNEGLFWEQVYKDPKGGCWLWQGPTNKRYGRTRFQGKEWFAHRLAYTLLWGNIPDGKHLDHLCCNTLCVFPWHLEAVTPAENDRRKVLRRRLCRTRSEVASPSGCRDFSNKKQRRSIWYEAWLHSFKPVFTSASLAPEEKS